MVEMLVHVPGKVEMLVLALERLKLLVHVNDNESNASSCSWKG